MLRKLNSIFLSNTYYYLVSKCPLVGERKKYCSAMNDKSINSARLPVKNRFDQLLISGHDLLLWAIVFLSHSFTLIKRV